MGRWRDMENGDVVSLSDTRIGMMSDLKFKFGHV